MSLYTTLDHSKHEIRVVRLLPGLDSSPVRCCLKVVFLEEQPRYEALSYVWGTCKENVDISMNNAVLPVTQNLHAALTSLRFPYSERVLWVDALCINQEDRDERSSQVSIMGHIFREAHRVLVWLGDSDTSASEGLESDELVRNLRHHATLSARNEGREFTKIAEKHLSQHGRSVKTFHGDLNYRLPRAKSKGSTHHDGIVIHNDAAQILEDPSRPLCVYHFRTLLVESCYRIFSLPW